MATVGPAAVSGSFYPADPVVLRRSIEDLLDEDAPVTPEVRPAILIAPHAGYVYSGRVAASAYRLIRGARCAVHRVVLLGPSHFAWFPGLASSGVDSLATPLGEVPVEASTHPMVRPNPTAHAGEHSLEVQLPFLQIVLTRFSVLPLLTGDVAADAVADVLEAALRGDDVVGIVSSDLSHYLDYDAARDRDLRTAAAITELRPADVSPEDACGRIGIQAALVLARRQGWACRLLDLRSSGDTSGSRDRVVGYGAFALGPEA